MELKEGKGREEGGRRMVKSVDSMVMRGLVTERINRECSADSEFNGGANNSGMRNFRARSEDKNKWYFSRKIGL